MNDKLPRNLKSAYNIELNQPVYMYQVPMFMLTVSTVIIVENGVLLIKNGDTYRFPTTMIKAGHETIPFAALRSVKEETGIVLKMADLIPVDFRSSPERSREGNIVDIGMACTFNQEYRSDKWFEVDFENKIIMDTSVEFEPDCDILLERSINMITMIN